MAWPKEYIHSSTWLTNHALLISDDAKLSLLEKKNVNLGSPNLTKMMSYEVQPAQLTHYVLFRTNFPPPTTNVPRNSAHKATLLSLRRYSVVMWASAILSPPKSNWGHSLSKTQKKTVMPTSRSHGALPQLLYNALHCALYRFGHNITLHTSNDQIPHFSSGPTDMQSVVNFCFGPSKLWFCTENNHNFYSHSGC